MQSKTLFTPEQFVPAEVNEYSGRERIAARIKMKPEDFTVEERQGATRLCTSSISSDLDAAFEVGAGKPGLVGATLVKRQLTTFAAVYAVAKELGISANRVSYAGLKDRWALTAQRIVIEGANIEDVRRACCPDRIVGAGWFIKDAAPANSRLSKGQLVSNRFTLNVQVPGCTARQIEQYVTPRLNHLAENGWVIPNAYGRQRLGRRQNLYQIGETLIRQGAEVAIKRFLFETSSGEREAATRLREKMAKHWLWFQNMKEVMEEPLDRGEASYKCLNMDVEYKIVCRLAETGSFEGVMSSMLDEFSLWIGAYQSFWFNQALGAVIRKEIEVPCVVREVREGNGAVREVREPGDCLPLLVFDKKWDKKRRRLTDEDGEAISFYKQHFPASVPEKIDPEVKRLFLTPRMNHRGPSIPWRMALIPVQGLTHSAEDGMWHCRFELRSGGYATTLLGLLFDLDGEEDATADERVRQARLGEKAGSGKFGRR